MILAPNETWAVALEHDEPPKMVSNAFLNPGTAAIFAGLSIECAPTSSRAADAVAGFAAIVYSPRTGVG
jgi:hypothetical protein